LVLVEKLTAVLKARSGRIPLKCCGFQGWNCCSLRIPYSNASPQKLNSSIVTT